MKPLSFASLLVLSTISTQALAAPLDTSADVNVKESNQEYPTEAQVIPSFDTVNPLMSPEQLERRSHKHHGGCGCGGGGWWSRKRDGNTERLPASSEQFERRWHQNGGGCGCKGDGRGCGCGKLMDSKRAV